MKVRDLTSTPAIAGVALIAGSIVYLRTKDSIKLYLEKRKTMDLEKTVDLLNERLEKNPHLITVRFEAA